MRFSVAITTAILVAGSAAAGCPYAQRAQAADAAAAGCPYAKRVAAPVKEAPVLSRRGPIDGKKGIFYSKCLFE